MPHPESVRLAAVSAKITPAGERGRRQVAPRRARRSIHRFTRRLVRDRVLQLEEPIVEAALRQQLEMTAALAQYAVAQDQYAVGPFDGGKSMPDDDRGTLRKQFVEGELDQALGFAVHAGGRLVHDQDARVVGERARKR